MGLDPYRPPRVDEAPIGPWVDQSSRVRRLMFVLGAIPFLEVTAILLAQWYASSQLQLALGTVRLVLSLVGAWLFLAFLARASSNAAVASGRLLRTSPAMLVGWFFVPIANLWKPRDAVREIWDALPAASDASIRADPLARWWGAWVITMLIGGVPVVGPIQAMFVVRYLGIAAFEPVWGIGSKLAMALASWQALLLVRALHQRQRAPVERTMSG